MDAGCTGLSEMESEKEVVGASVSLGCVCGAATVERFLSGCSATGAPAFLFPRSLLVMEGLLSPESHVLCSSLLDEPAELRGRGCRLLLEGGRIRLLSNGRVW